jgi:CheY-like chemotaxis protein
MSSAEEPTSSGRLTLRAPVRVLVVDDNEDFRSMAEYTLQGLGIETLLAADGAEAVDLFIGDVDIDLVLMDMQMPVMHGLVATRKMRQIENEHAHLCPRRVPIVACTSELLQTDDESFQESGLSDFLPKPFLSSRIIACLQRWCPEKVERSW